MLSVIITTLNEDNYILNRTIKTIRNSADCEIIVIDDYSDNEPIIQDKKVIFERNDFRIGCAQSRHKGATLASNKYLLFTDAHMIFENKFYDNFLNYSAGQDEKTIYCGTCLGLSENNQEIQNYSGKYCGARLELIDKKENNILEGKWIPEKQGDFYDITCLMGALYFIDRNYFFKLRGFSDLKMWGSDEPLISIKTLLSGGSIKLLKNVRAGHIFRGTAPYVTQIKYLIYNKLRMIYSFIDDTKLQNELFEVIPNDINKHDAIKLLQQENKIIKEYKNYYKSIFVHDFNWLMEKLKNA